MIATFYYNIIHEGEQYFAMYQEEFKDAQEAYDLAQEIAHVTNDFCTMRMLNTEYIGRP